MKPIKEIKNYLAIETNKRDYTDGYKLFCKFSNNISLQRYFSRKEDREKLFYKLECIASQDVINETKIANIPTINNALLGINPNKNAYFEIIEKKSGRINPDELPDELKSVFEKIQIDYKEMRFQYESMKKAENDTERKKCRDIVTTLDDKVKANWLIIDSFLNSKSIAVATDEIPNTNENSINAKTINAARVYLSKNLSKFDTLSDSDKTALIPKLKERYDLLVEAGNNFDEQTISILTSNGIIESREIPSES